MPEEIILTESSYRQLQQELEYLKTVKRAEIAEALRKARAYGDLSENFEYQAARRDQGILNGRIAEMEHTLEVARIVPDDTESGEGGAALGSVVMVRDLDSEDEWEYTLVDRVQADPINDRISVQSPVGQALLNKKVGEIVEIQVPSGKARYEILGIRRE